MKMNELEGLIKSQNDVKVPSVNELIKKQIKERESAKSGRVIKFFNSEDKVFVTACTKVGLKPTKRQTSKWLNKKGLAYKEGRV
jgi:hypothetical protein